MEDLFCPHCWAQRMAQFGALLPALTIAVRMAWLKLKGD